MNVLRLVALAVALPAIPLVALAKAHVVDTSAAPADEYFGPQKMSAIGIRMRIDALGRAYHARTLADGDLVHDAQIAETALHAWNARYPRDTWLAPTALHLEQLYAEVPSPEARAHALTMLHFISDTYGTTRYGHLSRLRLAQGFPPLPPQSAANAEAPAAVSPQPSSSASAPDPSNSTMPTNAPSSVPSGPA